MRASSGGAAGAELRRWRRGETEQAVHIFADQNRDVCRQCWLQLDVCSHDKPMTESLARSMLLTLPLGVSIPTPTKGPRDD